MKKYFVAFACWMSVSVLDTQLVRYATRFRNFTVYSQTNSIYMINTTIFQCGAEHRLNADVNITKDVHIKAIHVVIHRCAFEKSACEYFQTWRFKDNFKAYVFMKNQMWTPMFTAVTPRLDYPLIRKNIYRTRNATMNTDAAVLFYPEITKYYWRSYIIGIDNNDKKALVLVFELSIFEYVERNRKLKARNTKI